MNAPQVKKPVIANPKAILLRRMDNKGLRRKTEAALAILRKHDPQPSYQPSHEV